MFYLGVDFGITNIRAALSDQEGVFYTIYTCDTEVKAGREQVLWNIVNAVEAVIGNVDRTLLKGLAIGVPAPINPSSGTIFTIPGLKEWDNFPLAEYLRQKLSLPVFVENDANLAALGEYTFGVGGGKDYRCLVYLTISTGVGTGIIYKGQFFEGSNGFAGELGHTTVDVNGERCVCGNTGCLAHYVCGGAIRNQAINLLQNGADSVLREWCNGDLTKITSKMVGEAAQQGDQTALELLQRTGKYLGAGVTNIIHAFNPDVIVIGGGVAQIGAPLFEPMQVWVNQNAITIFQKQVAIVPASLGDNAGLYGTIAYAKALTGK
jgi:glucokinase